MQWQHSVRAGDRNYGSWEQLLEYLRLAQVINNIKYYRNCKRSLKWPSMQQWQCPIYNRIIKSFVWWSMKCISIIFVSFKPFIFNWSFSEKWLAHFLLRRSNEEKIDYFLSQKNDVIVHLLDKIKVVRVLL